MGKGSKGLSGLTIGLDLGDKHTVGCVLSCEGNVLETFWIATTPRAVRRTMEGFAASRVVLEVGTHSPWMSRVIESVGHELIIANPRRVRLIAENDSKTDEVDAELLARLARVDPGLLKPIVHRGEEAQRDRILLLARDGLVRSRTQLVNSVRGFAKSLGHRMPTSSTEAFPRRVRERLGEDVFPGQSAMLDVIDRLTEGIAAMDREAERLCKERYPETGVMRQVKGGGSAHVVGVRVDRRRPESFREEPERGCLCRSSASHATVRRTTTPASDHEGGRCRVASLPGDGGAVHLGSVRSRHGASSLRVETGRAGRQGGEEACGGGGGSEVGGAAPSPVGDRRRVLSGGVWADRPASCVER